MCGKFTQRRDIANVVRLSGAFALEPVRDETVTPMRTAQVIALNGEGLRKSVAMRWGLVPAGRRDPAGMRDPADARDEARPHIHARAETIDTKPTFRESFARRRGIVLTTTFNEAEEIGSKTVQYVLAPRDAAPVAIAVVWDRLREHDGRWLLTFAMVTVAANPLIATIADRMPALIEAQHWPKWLGEEPATVDELKAMLHPSTREFDMARATKPPPERAAQAELF
ncbi:MAG: SOS response-associated peptidase [Alphaproteobacteria bacterium]|nr:SOS response-associated peptidase [Alphaproteobacteria bacterium]